MLELNEQNIARLHSMTLQLKSDLAFRHMAWRFEAFREALIEEKYRPDQPRAPRGTPDGGQWILDPSSARQQRLRDERVLVAQNRPTSFYSVDLEREESGNKRSHAFSRHVGKSFPSLVAELDRTRKVRVDPDGTATVKWRPVLGTFRTPGEANDLVSSALRRNTQLVELAVQGSRKVEIVERFPYQTGFEAFREFPFAEPILRPTFGVTVVLAREENDRGYLVITAFPMNNLPNEVLKNDGL